MTKWKVLLAIALAALGLSACAGMSSELEHFQGHWVDLNSEATLDISKNKMTVSISGIQEVYTVRAQKEDDVFCLVNADGSGGFGWMSELTEYQEGHLSANEMVLDAEGHSYVFVREETKEEERKIQDNSTDMPKTIASDVIASFDLGFTNRGQYGLSDEWPECSYSWSISREDDGTWFCDYMEMYDDMAGRSYYGEVTEEFMKNLAECIQNAGIPEHNGYHMGNSVSGTDYSLHVVYDSGEEVKIVATGDAGDSCVFDLETLLEAIRPLIEEQNE